LIYHAGLPGIYQIARNPNRDEPPNNPIRTARACYMFISACGPAPTLLTGNVGLRMAAEA